jgi:hypothetical protein
MNFSYSCVKTSFKCTASRLSVDCKYRTLNDELVLTKKLATAESIKARLPWRKDQKFPIRSPAPEAVHGHGPTAKLRNK